MPLESTIYLDESGNDGPNYISAQDPFYVLGGWIVPDRKIVDATVLMERFRQAHSSQTFDLKFKMFRRRPYLLCELMTKLGEIGLVPMFVLAEKRYCIAGKIVETFLDPYYSSKLRGHFGVDLEAKREIANTLYERLPTSVLNEFAASYREPSQTGFESVLSRVVASCREHVNAEVAELMLGSEDRLGDIAAAELHAVDAFGKGSATINAPCLISMAMLIEQLGRKHDISPQRIVHDEQGPYQTDFARIFQSFLSAPEEHRFQLEGMDVPFGAIRNINTLEFQKSEQQPLVQAADLLAGSIAHVAKKLVGEESLHVQESELAMFAFLPMYVPQLRLANPVCSERMLKRIGGAIREKMGISETDESSNSHAEQTRWTSTLPPGDMIPLLPARGSAAKPKGHPDHRIKIDLPFYSIANEDRELVLLLPPDVSMAQTQRDQRMYLLWTDKALAEGFLSDQDWVGHSVVEFGPPELDEFIELLRQGSQWTDWVYFQFPQPHGHMPIKRLADDLERVWQRSKRLFQTGLASEVYRQHEFDGEMVYSALMGTGDYVAIRISDGLRGSGDTREEALGDLQKTIGDASSVGQ
ncbi:hypothetical protein CA13_19980 [Planctomycetes bacterium CA13]|uniref:DUF3800 domain-containing protein n=2 Tax=Novipirellula herctigrandis TaxID=2527986 RepID=A0A5C5Z1T6_9BACT|nr:hypothetical protein CA13_19980 [Planctomycetes bacterium CA13]